ncbi:MAG: hypothetical protein KatS3mg031_1049 [Chitinophagales bacterium]|nr:MAG: hypothetical protein KatS3mg031_1049 [Chitinophagales bacterium]
MRVAYYFIWIVLITGSGCHLSDEKHKEKADSQSVAWRNSHREQMGLKGSVKHLYEITFYALSHYGEVVPGEPIEGTEYSYLFDRQGMLTEKIFCERPDNYSEKWSCKLNELGFPVEAVIVDPSGKRSMESYRYDEKGNLIEKKLFKPQIQRWTFTYDNQGRRTSMTVYDLPYNEMRTTTYDAEGNPKEVMQYFADGNLKEKYLCKHTFDKEGNWIQQIQYTAHIPDIAPVPAFITIREIEYYEL